MFPSLAWDLTLGRIGVAVLIFAFGYPLHELMHALPYILAGVDYDAELAPEDEPFWYSFLFGRLFKIEPQEEVSLKLTLVSVLAPGILCIPALIVLAVMLTYPVVSVSSLLLVGSWFVIFLPSALDWAVALGILNVMTARKAQMKVET